MLAVSSILLMKDTFYAILWNDELEGADVLVGS
jgi:hypothetical protein